MCNERTWERTIDSLTYNRPEDLKKIEPTALEGEAGERGLVEVRLNGPQLVEYLHRLNRAAHPGKWEGTPDPMAQRMYAALTPVVDSIDPTAVSAEIPQVSVDDLIGVPAADDEPDS